MSTKRKRDHRVIVYQTAVDPEETITVMATQRQVSAGSSRTLQFLAYYLSAQADHWNCIIIRLRRQSETYQPLKQAGHFVSDALFDGRRLRAMTIVDNYTCECLAIEKGKSLRGENVVRTLENITAGRGWPQSIKVDNLQKLISKSMDRRAQENGVELNFSRPGNPIDNAKGEFFNGRFLGECLNTHLFLSLVDAKGRFEAWRQGYNE